MSAKPKGPSAPAPKSRPAAPENGAGSAADPRATRLAQALRDNLKKRKAQQRQRREGGS